MKLLGAYIPATAAVGFTMDSAVCAVESTITSRSPHADSEILQAFAVFARTALDLDDEHLKLLTEGFPKLARGLAEQARRFDPTLSASDIFQASRNVWTAAGLQV